MKRRLIVGVQSLSAAVGLGRVGWAGRRPAAGGPPVSSAIAVGLTSMNRGPTHPTSGYATRCCGFRFLVALTYFAYAAAASFQGLRPWAAVAIIKAMAISSCRSYGQSQKSAADKRPVQSTVRMRNRSGRSRAVRVHQPAMIAYRAAK